MFLPLFLILGAAAIQDAAAKAGPVLRSVERDKAVRRAAAVPGEPPRFTRCMDLATSDSKAGIDDAVQWQGEGGGMFARQCLAVAYANQRRWDSAARAFEEAAHAAETIRDAARAAIYWAQAGNAWLAAGDAGKARAGLSAALATGALKGLTLGEAYLDRARAAVAAGDQGAARTDLDIAIAKAPADPLIWLLSATLARRMGDVPRAQRDIGEAMRRAADDPSVRLEAGNIAAAAGDEAGARAAWEMVGKLAPGSAAAKAAAAALAQFGGSAGK